MSEMDVEKRLENGIYGKPQLKADECRKYLGNFRERILVTMNNEEIHDDCYFKSFSEKLKEGFAQEVVLFLNGALDTSVTSKYSLLAKSVGIPYMIKQGTDSITNETIVLVLATKNDAVNSECVDIAELFPHAHEQLAQKMTAKKKGFFGHLFGK